MFDLVIVGAGGFSRELRELIVPWLTENNLKPKGFLSNNPADLAGFECTEPVIGSPSEYVPQPKDRFLLAIGDPAARRRVVTSLESRGAKFSTYIHPTAVVAATATIGNGCILYPYAVVMNGAVLGSHVLLNLYASAGHDSRIGNYSNLCPYATLNGFAVLEEEVFVASHATVQPSSRVGARSKVSANSSARGHVPPGSLVFGVPGRIVPLPPT